MGFPIPSYQTTTTYGYITTANTPGLWQPKTRRIYLTVVVYDFGVNYVGRQNVEHLINDLATLYILTTEWEGKSYCGPILNWDYNACTVDLTMHGYTPEALHRFQHTNSQLPQHSPHHWNLPNYNAPTQLTPIIRTSATSHCRASTDSKKSLGLYSTIQGPLIPH